MQLLRGGEAQGGVGLAGHRHGHGDCGVGLGSPGNPAAIDNVKLMVTDGSLLEVIHGAQAEVTETACPHLKTAEVGVCSFVLLFSFRFAFLLFETNLFKMTFALAPGANFVLGKAVFLSSAFV